MTLRAFGRTGVRVSPLTLGAMMFGAWGNPDHDDSIRIIHRALDAGINIIDTADMYSRGESEEIVGKALAGGLRDEVVLATKFHAPMDDNLNHRGNSRRWIIREVENSLLRLRTDWIDLYQVHRPEPGTDFDDTLGALSDLVHQGKIRYIGTSTFEPSAIVEGQWIAQRRGRERVVSEQPPYSLLARGIEREVLPVAQRYGLAVIPWSPLAGGWLTGRYRKGVELPVSGRSQRTPGRFDLTLPANVAKLEAVEQLALLAEEAGLSLVHLAIAFVLEHPAVTSAIIGPRTMEQLESQLDAAKVTLSPDVLDRIDEIVPPGTTINTADGGYEPPSLTDPAYRRRTTVGPE
ncbi:aldo/keto reductase [Frankia sp. Cas3]|uniref:aldo/keto reductase n=1 Tax=Frankia sp. Cas3 TaxID=3073926 RepID=UPI002AD3CCD7|nr:aldo/keto reductase [Frankia sp. Cas3]